MDFDLFESLWENANKKMESKWNAATEEDTNAKTSKKEEYIANLEDFIELTCALCPSEEEIVRNKGKELIEEIKKM